MVARDLGQVWQSQPNICQQRWGELGWGAKTITTNFLLRINSMFSHICIHQTKPLHPWDQLWQMLWHLIIGTHCWHCWDSSILSIWILFIRYQCLENSNDDVWKHQLFADISRQRWNKKPLFQNDLWHFFDPSSCFNQPREGYWTNLGAGENTALSQIISTIISGVTDT